MKTTDTGILYPCNLLIKYALYKEHTLFCVRCKAGSLIQFLIYSVIESINVIKNGNLFFKVFKSSVGFFKCVTLVHLDFIAMKYVGVVGIWLSVYTWMEHAYLDVVLVIRVTCAKHVSILFIAIGIWILPPKIKYIAKSAFIKAAYVGFK